ncbi:MAG TPA: hypothetical protein VHF51_03435 [Solirubrobacteraceae bacterium]|nr:hypothetical protein [Solirubrobacteraceae bacterium]
MLERDDPFHDAASDESSERRDWDLPPDVQEGAPRPGAGQSPESSPHPAAEPDEPGRAG